ncbi:iron chelate uptake ABC transporter family permease subunit [Iamia sp. SCSIO 61187]|nr:iron chelate uptake ABC transporter family permease subunit [Iamia sp. SCSIO 61187]
MRPRGALCIRLGPVSARVDLRAVAISLGAGALAFLVLCWSVSVGDYPIALSEVIRTLAGQGVDPERLVIHELRLPRATLAASVGAAFGLSGAIFQRITGNPLASPDLIGVNSGAAASAVAVIVVFAGSPTQVAAGSLVGAGLAALAVYLLAWKAGVSTYRLILIGIAVGAFMSAVTSWLLTKADIYDAARAALWLAGDVSGAGWDDVQPLWTALAVLTPAALVLARQLRMLELGDDAARALGARVERVRGLLLLVGVGLAAVAVSASGPIVFVALAAPHIARRLTGGRTVGLLPAAVLGALLLGLSDLAAKRIIAPSELPVGIVTAILGAPYLLVLLALSNRIGRGA